MSENKDSRTASQKIDDLEKVTAVCYNTMQDLVRVSNELAKIADEVPLLNQAIRLLNRRLEAVVSVANESSGVTAQAVTDAMIKANVEDLKTQISNWVTNGSLAPTDVVADDSFLVGVEINKDGSVFNARLQFPLSAQPEDNQAKLKGAKVGDTIHFEENNPSFQITELYTVTKPAAPAAPALAVVPDAPAETTEVPAASSAPATDAAPPVAADSASADAPASVTDASPVSSS